MSKIYLPTEHDEQVLFVKWFKIKYPKVKIFAVPNGTRASMHASLKAKREGVSKGVPDLMIPKLFLFIEMKRQKGGTTSVEQKEWVEYLNEIGYTAKVCKGADEAIALIESMVGSK